MDDILVIGGGPAGLFSAWLAHQGGAKVRLLAAGIGTTHVMPGWIGVLDTDGDLDSGLTGWIDRHPDGPASAGCRRQPHPYALAGLDALHAGVAALQTLCEPAGLRLVGGFERNLRLPSRARRSHSCRICPRELRGRRSQPARTHAYRRSGRVA